MNYRLVYYINNYKNMIINETYDHIIYEMLNDLKETLLLKSNDIDTNFLILESFHEINNSDDIIERLNNLENILTEGSGLSISNIKAKFFDKHQKIIDRDKKWLNKNKKNILGLNYEEIELEVLSDYKVTFEQLLNRHNIFDKIFVNSENDLSEKLRRFEDKHENLKNGLDNYFRTGTSRREIGLRKVSGDEAKLAVENMIAYCESFLSGKQFLEEKMNNIIVSISDSSVKESLSPIETLKILLEKDESTKANMNKSKEESIDNKKSKNNVDEIEDTSEELEDISDGKQDGKIEKEENVNEEPETNEEENIDTEEQPKEERGIEDRQVGIAVLLSIAEERYFDNINILKGLIEEE